MIKTMIKYCDGKGRHQLMIRLRCVRCSRLNSIIGWYGSKKGREAGLFKTKR